MDGWFLENGIGENRAILIEQGRIIEAHIDRPGDIKAGMIAQMQLTEKNKSGNGGKAAMENGAQTWVGGLPAAITQGQSFNAKITREAISERSRQKLPLAKFTTENTRPAPCLRQRIEASATLSGEAPKMQNCLPGGRDYLAQAGWADILQQAQSGIADFAGGNLDIMVTPAMTTIDVDGDMDALPLSIAAARESALAIRRLGLAGSIGIDFPDVGGKAARNQVAEAFDEAMQIDCERTGINGFGLLHLVTRRVRPSLLEIMQMRRTLGHAIDLVRQAQWLPSSGEVTLSAHPAIITHIEAHPDWITQLEKSRGGEVTLQANGKISIGGGYAA